MSTNEGVVSGFQQLEPWATEYPAIKVLPSTQRYKQGELSSNTLLGPQLNVQNTLNKENTTSKLFIKEDGTVVTYHFSRAFNRWIITEYNIPNYRPINIVRTWNWNASWRTLGNQICPYPVKGTIRSRR